MQEEIDNLQEQIDNLQIQNSSIQNDSSAEIQNLSNLVLDLQNQVTQLSTFSNSNGQQQIEYGQLAFPLSLETLQYLKDALYDWVYAMNQLYVGLHFFSGGIAFSNGTVTIPNPFERGNSTKLLWNVEVDYSLATSPTSFTTDGAGAVTPNSSTFYLDGSAVNNIDDTPDILTGKNQWVLTFNDPQLLGIIHFSIIRDFQKPVDLLANLN